MYHVVKYNLIGPTELDINEAHHINSKEDRHL